MKKYIAKTIQGLEDVLLNELIDLGAKNPQIGRRMVEFFADTKTMYKMNYHVSTALRILESFHTFKFSDINDYYEAIRSLAWDTIIHENDTIAVDASVFQCNAFNNSHFTEMKTKDAVADFFRDKYGKRPSVDLKNPSLRINIYIQADECHVSLDTSGTPLYKRDYRDVLHEASLNEVLAAGLIRMTGWDRSGVFYDPMCGGATISIEAAMYALQMPAGYYRTHWGFMNWKSYQEAIWKSVLSETNPLDEQKQFEIHASDISMQSIRIARKNIAKAKMMKIIHLQQSSFENLKPLSDNGILVMNPPYNVRMEVEDMIDFYKQIGNHLKHHFNGHQAWIISSDINALKHLGLRPSKKIHTMNGPLEARFHAFNMY
jgi:putative N6-adenine-specific DNA methylase